MDSYLEDKQDQIEKWHRQLKSFDALCKEQGDDISIKFEVQLAQFRQNLDNLQGMIREFQGVNEAGRDKFIQLIETYWSGFEQNFSSVISEYEQLIQAKTEE